MANPRLFETEHPVLHLHYQRTNQIRWCVRFSYNDHNHYQISVYDLQKYLQNLYLVGLNILKSQLIIHSRIEQEEYLRL